MNFYVMTLFPEMIENGLMHSMIKRAVENKIVKIESVNIRDYTKDKHNRVDDYPYGGGAGMVMQAQPIYDCYLHIKNKVKYGTKVVYLTPQGKTLTQQMAQDLSTEQDLILLCGHYEGIDERVIEEIVTDEISIGDYVLTGGELPAMVLIDSVSRLISGVLGKDASFELESFSDNLLEYPQYTRPSEFLGRSVPEVLISGHHENINKWRREKSIERTRTKRPDLLARNSEVK